MATLRGVTLPNRGWDLLTMEERAAISELRPDCILALGYPDSPVLAEKVSQEAALWNLLGKPRFILRVYDKHIIMKKAETWAQVCVNLARRYLAAGLEIESLVCANEMNLETPDDEVGFRTDWHYQAGWIRSVSQFLHSYLPRVKVPIPALSPSGHFLEGWRVYAQWGLGTECDAAHIHIYNEAQMIHAQIVHDIIGLPVTVSEINQLPPSFYIPKFAQMPFVDGAVWFILCGD